VGKKSQGLKLALRPTYCPGEENLSSNSTPSYALTVRTTAYFVYCLKLSFLLLSSLFLLMFLLPTTYLNNGA